MKVFELLDEILEILDTATKVPLKKSVIVDPNELREIVEDIRSALPESMHMAKWVIEEQEKLKEDARSEADSMISHAQATANDMVSESEILSVAKNRGRKILEKTYKSNYKMKMKTYDYMDKILYEFQERLQDMRKLMQEDFFENMERSFDSINDVIIADRESVKKLADMTKTGKDMVSDYDEVEEETQEEI